MSAVDAAIDGLSSVAAAMPSYVDALLADDAWRWNEADGEALSVTVSFLTGLPIEYWGGYESNGFAPLSDVQEAAAALAMAAWAEVAAIAFVVLGEGEAGDIRLGTATLPAEAAAWAYYPGAGAGAGGDVWLNNLYSYSYAADGTGYGYLTLLHELGHALALKHPGNYDASGGGTDGPYLPADQDSYQYSVMSYYAHPTAWAETPVTPMLYDIAAIQYLYGANMTTRAGDTVYAFAQGEYVIEAIWDAGGIDTIDMSNQIAAQIIDLEDGAFSTLGGGGANNVAIAFGALIENATGGAAADTLIGNEADNRLRGGLGADRLTGGDGYDVFAGSINELAGDRITDFALGDTLRVIGADLTRLGGTSATASLQLAAGKVLTLDGLAGNDTWIAVLDGSDTILALAGATAGARFSISGASGVYEGNAGGTAFTFTIQREGNIAGAAGLRWAVEAAGAYRANGADFLGGTLPAGSVTFAAGETSKTVTLQILGDTIVENNESFAIRLSDAVGGSIEVEKIDVSIYNDESVSSYFSVAATSATKAEGSGPFTFTVTRTGGTTAAASVDWSVEGSGGDPASAADFLGGSLPRGTLAFAVGETSRTITIDVLADNVIEKNEGFTLRLGNAAGAVIATSTAAGSILNDDQPPDTAGNTRTTARDLGTLEADGVSLMEWLGEGDTTDFYRFALAREGVVTANLEGLSADLDLYVYDAAGTLIADSSLAGTAPESLSLLLAQGTYYAQIVAAGSESDYAFSLSGPVEPARLSIAATRAIRAEGDAGFTAFTFTVTRSGNLSGEALVNWAVSGTSASPADAQDFLGGSLPEGMLHFAAGDTAKTITINVLADQDYENQEKFLVTIGDASGAVIETASAVGIIRNDDLAPARLSIAARDEYITEVDDGSSAVQFVVTRSGALDLVSSVRWEVFDGDAQASDFLGGVYPSGKLSFAAGEISKIITLRITGDRLAEEDEIFAIRLFGATGAVLEQDVAAAMILDNDGAPQITLDPTPISFVEGDDGYTDVTVHVARMGNLAGRIAASWRVLGEGENPANAADFADGKLPSGRIVFKAGSDAEASITFRVLSDRIGELDEGFRLELFNASGAEIVEGRIGGTILNDDPLGYFSISAAAEGKAEGTGGSGAFSFVIRRGGDVSEAASVAWSAAGLGDHAASADDFAGGVLPGGVLSFAAGELRKVVTIQTVGDNVFEQDEAFVVRLENAQGASIRTVQAQSVILNDDPDARFDIAAVTTDRAEGNAGAMAHSFVVTRTGDAGAAATLRWAVSGTGTNPVEAGDFLGGVLPFGTLNFAAGETSKTIIFRNLADTVFELDETFAVTLSDARGASLGMAAVSGVIRNDDVAPGRFSIASVAPSLVEGDDGITNFTFTVTRSGDATGQGSVAWSVAGNTSRPASAEDFLGGAFPSGVLSFAAGQTSRDIVVSVLGDTVLEQIERFRVTLSDPEGASLGTAYVQAMILNDDAAALAAAAELAMI